MKISVIWNGWLSVLGFGMIAIPLIILLSIVVKLLS